jgi:ubiquinone/menaquinone biosynthesis C-methylase UbiE
MTDHFKDIYANQSQAYNAMVSREDYEGNLLPALDGIRPLVDADVVEFGAGTGRVTRLLAPHVRHIHAFDAEPAMLAVARETLVPLGDNWALDVADNAHLPVEDDSADVAIEGWSFGHAPTWHGANWHAVIDSYLAEMARVLRTGGTAVLIETMGTGHETPAPPAPHLEELFAYFEGPHGFQYRWIRTDYEFESVEEAERLTRFFFGDELADRIVAEQMTILPECTGIWWRRY